MRLKIKKRNQNFAPLHIIRRRRSNRWTCQFVFIQSQSTQRRRIEERRWNLSIQCVIYQIQIHQWMCSITLWNLSRYIFIVDIKISEGCWKIFWEFSREIVVIQIDVNNVCVVFPCCWNWSMKTAVGCM